MCEVLLKHLTIENEAVWSKSLELVRKIIGGVDYKGCRELMKLLLDRFDKLPRCISNQDVPAIKNGQMVSVYLCVDHMMSHDPLSQLLSYILDRNAALLPAYFAHDEVGTAYHMIVYIIQCQFTYTHTHSSLAGTTRLTSPPVHTG